MSAATTISVQVAVGREAPRGALALVNAGAWLASAAGRVGHALRLWLAPADDAMEIARLVERSQPALASELRGFAQRDDVRPAAVPHR